MAGSSEKVLLHQPRQEVTQPEQLAEVQRDILNGKAGAPDVSPLLDALAPRRTFPLSPDRSYGWLKR